MIPFIGDSRGEWLELLCNVDNYRTEEMNPIFNAAYNNNDKLENLGKKWVAINDTLKIINNRIDNR